MSILARSIARAALPGTALSLARPKGQMVARQQPDPEQPFDDGLQPMRRAPSPGLARATVDHAGEDNGQDPEDAPAQALRRAAPAKDPAEPEKQPPGARDDDLAPLHRAIVQEPEGVRPLRRAPINAEDDPQADPALPLRPMARPLARNAPDADHLSADDSVKPDEMAADEHPAMGLRRDMMGRSPPAKMSTAAATPKATGPTAPPPDLSAPAPPAPAPPAMAGLPDWRQEALPDPQTDPQPAPQSAAPNKSQAERPRVVIEEVAVTFHDTPQPAAPDFAASLTRALRRRYIGGM